MSDCYQANPQYSDDDCWRPAPQDDEDYADLLERQIALIQTQDDGRAEQDAQEDGLEDDDPQCVCGVYRSEHQLCGCPEGFQTAAAWAAEHAIIVSMSATDYEKYYGG